MAFEDKAYVSGSLPSICIPATTKSLKNNRKPGSCQCLYRNKGKPVKAMALVGTMSSVPNMDYTQKVFINPDIRRRPILHLNLFFFTKLTIFVPFRLCWHQQKRQQNTVTAFTEIRPIQILKDVCPTPCGLSYTITLEWIESLLRDVKQSNTMVLCPYSTTHTTALTNAKRIASSFISRCLWKHMVQYYWRSAKWT